MAHTPPNDHENGRPLDPLSQAAVDRLLEHGHPPPDMSDDPHDVAVSSLLGLLDAYPVEESSDALIDATLARIDRHEAHREDQLNFEANDARRIFSRWRLPDVIATAAALFLAVGVGWPLWQTMQHNRIQGVSAARLGGIGSALASFAADHDDALPLDPNSDPGQPFDPVNVPHSRHLLNTLPQGEYLDRAVLFLHDPEAPAASFSYRVPHFGSAFRLRIIGPSSPLAGDANPLLWRLRNKTIINGHVEGSPTHGGRGQMILLGDLSTSWDDVAILLSDPIWTTNGCPEGNVPVCRPTTEADVFLAD
jgi:hypothetical protein